MTDTLGTQTVEERLGCLQELTKFTENCQKQLNDILETLGWSPEYDVSAQVAARQILMYLICYSLHSAYNTYSCIILCEIAGCVNALYYLLKQ